MTQVPRSHVRVATFVVTEVFQVAGNEWIRKDGQSIDESINQFLDDNSGKPLSVSAPNFGKIQGSAAEGRLSHSVSCSMIWEPLDQVIYDDVVKPEASDELKLIPSKLPTEGFPDAGPGLPAGTEFAEEARGQLLNKLSQQLGFKVVEDSGGGS